MSTITQPKITMRIEKIGPEQASILLQANTDNRKISRKRVTQFSNSMRNGQWLMTGEAIKVAYTGRLLDGQHRLEAVVESGVTIEVLVIRNMDPATMVAMDSGQSRSAGQSLGNVTNASNKAASALIMFAHELGLDPRQSSVRQMITRIDVRSYYDLNAEAMDRLSGEAWTLYSSVGGNMSGWLAFLVLAEKESAALKAEFVEAVRTGANLRPGDPRLALKNAIASPVNRKRNNHFHLGLLIKSWNLWLAGEQKTMATFRDTEAWPSEMRSKRSIQSRTLFAVPQAA